ncbi:MAG: GTPase domain-containing protein [Thermoanaerobaculia bacterium]|nr:GTPase domain-containing protein [Thermoanaerobaculia bacterium]
MVLFNYATKEITAKIVYYGPGLCGKTTNLQFVYDSLASNSKSKMLSLATKTDRTLFFDFLPLDLGKIRGMRTKLQLYTVPGQVYYNSTRQLVLKGADGIVFVADSQDVALDANLESMQNLEDNLKRQGIRIREIPMVIQYNKRDLPNAMPVVEIDRELNKLKSPHYGSVATTGLGVEQSLKGITHLVLAHLVKKYGLEGSEPLEREIQVLNATIAGSTKPDESLWDESDPADASLPPTPVNAPYGEPEFDLDDAAGHDDAPLVATELIGVPPRNASQRAPFEDMSSDPIEVPFGSIEIPLPSGILDSLPQLESRASATSVAEPPVPERSSEALVKEVSIPLNLSVDELRRHRRLRLKITLDVNLLP